MLEPVGPLSPRVYWARRLAVVAVVFAVVGLLLWVTLGRSQADSGSTPVSTSPTTIGELTGDLATPANSTGSSADTASSAASVASTTDVSASSESVAPSTDSAAAQSAAEAAAAQSAAEAAAAQSAAEAAAAQSAAEAAAAQSAAEAAAASSAAAAQQHDDQGRLICPDSSITLVATVGSPTYNVGEQPVIGVTVTNSGSEACVKDLSGGLQEFIAFDAAGNRVWSTNDCSPGTGTDVRFIQPGESLQYNIRWSGTTSQPGCAGDRLRVPAGDYSVEAHIGAVVSSRASLTFQ